MTTLTMFMYHRILPQQHPDAVSCDMFRQQLDLLQRKFRLLTPAQIQDFLDGKLTSGHYAALSFDDGWLDNLLYATPILQEHGLQACMALSAGLLQESDTVRTSEADDILRRSSHEAEIMAFQNNDKRPYLTRGELKHMLQSGCWHIEAHGTAHRQNARGVSVLAQPDTDAAHAEQFIRDDLSHCCETIQTLTGYAPRMMFWPWGHYSAASVAAARKLGLDIQFTVRKGLITPGEAQHKVLPRVGINQNQRKFLKSCFLFKYPSLAWLNGCFHTEHVEFPLA